MRFWILALGLCVVALGSGGCTGDASPGEPDAAVDDDAMALDTADPGDTAADSEVDGGQADTDDAQADLSAPPPPDALYTPEATYEVAVSTFEGITYQDALGQDRVLNLAVYRPRDAPLPAPVVLLSHGGTGGKTVPTNSLPEWADTVASAGYIAVAIAHPGRSQADYDALCAHLGVPTEIRCGIKLNWDRPHDVARVLDWLQEQSSVAPFQGALDLTRVAHLGHSAGAGAALMLAGAPRNFRCAQPLTEGQGTVIACDPADLVTLSEPRIRAVVAMSPQGVGIDGFTEGSYPEVTLPVLLGSGIHDGNDEGEPEARRTVFEQLPTSADALHRFFIWLDDPGTRHTLFQGSVDACSDLVGRPRCTELRRWLFSTVVAFLDHELRDSALAAQWLADGGASGVGAPTVEWNRK